MIEHERAFRTHSNYIRAFAEMAGSSVGGSSRSAHQRLAEQCAALSSFNDKPTISARPDAVQPVLANAWGTELLLGIVGTLRPEEEILRLSNNWGVVQTYYVAALATRAHSHARGGQVTNTHQNTWSAFAAHWLGRPLMLPPWTFGLGRAGYIHPRPSGEIDEGIHSWASCDRFTSWDLAAKALQTTRAPALEERVRSAREAKRTARRKEWSGKEQQRVLAGRPPRTPPNVPLPRLTPQEREEAVLKVRDYGFIDYLYRLRRRSNYEDAEMFTEGPIEYGASLRVHRDLVFLASTTLLVHEMHIGALMGKRKFMKLMDEWIKTNGGGLQVGVMKRRELLNSIL